MDPDYAIAYGENVEMLGISRYQCKFENKDLEKIQIVRYGLLCFIILFRLRITPNFSRK